MSDEERGKELSGLARSIGSLFRESERTLPPATLSPHPGLAVVLGAGAAKRPGEGDPEAVAAVVERLLLWGANDPESLALARELATDAVCEVIVHGLVTGRRDEGRPGLVEAARLLGVGMAPPLGRALSKDPERGARRTYLQALIAVGEGASQVAGRMVEDGRWFVVRNGVAALGEIGGARAVERVVPALAHGDPRVRREAVRALGKIGGDAAAQLVLGMVGDPDAEVRLAAALAVGSLKVLRALRPLLDLLDRERDPDVVMGILKALGQLGDPGAVPTVERRAVRTLLSRPRTDVRVAAYRALHAIGTPRSRGLLARAADDRDPVVRREVRRLLRIG